MVVQSAHPKQVMGHGLIDVTVVQWWCTIESMELQSYKTNCRKPVNNSHKLGSLVVALDHEPL